MQLDHHDWQQDPYLGSLFSRDPLSQILAEEPRLRRSILGLGVCEGAQGRKGLEYARAIHAAYVAWEGKIPFDTIHNAVGPMRDLRNEAVRKDPDALTS